MNTRTASAPPAPSRAGPGFDLRRVFLGVFTFLTLGLIGVWAAARLAPGGEFTGRSLLQAVPVSMLAICVTLALLDVLLGGVRLHLWVSRVAPGTGLGASIQTYLVNLFAAAVSPMGSASAPAQVAALNRYGVGPARALAALVLKFISVLGGFVIVCSLGFIYLASGPGLEGTLGTVLRGLVGGVLGVMALVVLAVGNPRLGHALSARVSGWGSRGSGALRAVATRIGSALEKGVSDYESALSTLVSDWHRPMFLSLALSSVMVLNKCLIGFLLAAAMGYTGGFAEVAARQSIQWLLIYFSPSPGGSGLAEATVPAFLSGIVPPGSVVEYTILWRLITGFIGPALGAVATVRIFGRRRGHRVDSPARSMGQ